jgi:formylglycine-generating enzyme required for sulfatase activity
MKIQTCWRVVKLCGLLALALPCGAAPPQLIKTSGGTEMVLIPAGTFVMGSGAGTEDARPAHKISVSSFYMDRHEVTQESYEDLMGVNPSKFEGDTNPVEQVRWTQAVKYCNARSRKEGLAPCYNETTWQCDFSAGGYRLPTEAEWEYACRAGAATAYAFGDDPQGLGAHAWFKDNAGRKSHPVGGKRSNAWGLQDMHGNVAEWCHDFYAADYYRASPAQDPQGPAAGAKRVVRGGSWAGTAEKCAAWYRAAEAQSLPDVCLGYDIYGFRCVRRASGTTTPAATSATTRAGGDCSDGRALYPRPLNTAEAHLPRARRPCRQSVRAV